jgi:tRNA(Ile)-lysidine synthase
MGHQADDNAELVLMFLIRGSGPVGFSGIPPIRDGRFVRPLIRTSREEIAVFLRSSGLSAMLDPSNTDLRFTRNRIRQLLIPLLQNEFNPRIVESLNRFADIQRDEISWTDELVRNLFSSAVVSRESGRLCLAGAVIRRQPRALRRRTLRLAVAEAKGDLRRVGLTHVDAVLRLLESQRTQGRLDLPGGIVVRKLYAPDELLEVQGPHRMEGCAASDGEVPLYEYTVTSPDRLPQIVTLKEVGMQIRFSIVGGSRLPPTGEAGQQVAFFDMDRLQFPLVIRNRRAGDRFCPLGLKGSQKVKKFFIDRKVPRPLRGRCPLLLSGERIVWVVGHRTDATARVTPVTRRIVKAELV